MTLTIISLTLLCSSIIDTSSISIMDGNKKNVDKFGFPKKTKLVDTSLVSVSQPVQSSNLASSKVQAFPPSKKSKQDRFQSFVGSGKNKNRSVGVYDDQTPKHLNGPSRDYKPLPIDSLELPSFHTQPKLSRGIRIEDKNLTLEKIIEQNRRLEKILAEREQKRIQNEELRLRELEDRNNINIPIIDNDYNRRQEILQLGNTKLLQ